MSDFYHLNLKQKTIIFFFILIMIPCFIFRVHLIRFLNTAADAGEDMTVQFGSWIKPPDFNDDKIAVILIDPKIDPKDTELSEPEMKKLRGKCAKLIRKLTDVGARVIAFDILFKDSMEYENNEPDNDKLLSDAIQMARKRGTSIIIGMDAEKGPESIDLIFKNAVGGGYGIAVGLSRLGKIFKMIIANKMFYKNLPKDEPKDRYEYALPLKAVESYLGGKIKKSDFQIPPIEIEQNSICQAYLCNFFDSKIIKTDQYEAAMANLFIDFSYDENKIPLYSYKSFAQLSYDDLLNKFNSKIVMVGLKVENDIFSTIVGKRYGVQIHADAVNTVLNDVYKKRTIRALPVLMDYISTILFGILGIILSLNLHKQHITKLNKRLFGIRIIFLVFIFIFEFSILMYTQERILMSWVYCFVTFLSAFSIADFFVKGSIHEKT